MKTRLTVQNSPERVKIFAHRWLSPLLIAALFLILRITMAMLKIAAETLDVTIGLKNELIYISSIFSLYTHNYKAITIIVGIAVSSHPRTGTRRCPYDEERHFPHPRTGTRRCPYDEKRHFPHPRTGARRCPYGEGLDNCLSFVLKAVPLIRLLS